jgi:hypothetical protein
LDHLEAWRDGSFAESGCPYARHGLLGSPQGLQDEPRQFLSPKPVAALAAGLLGPDQLRLGICAHDADRGVEVRQVGAELVERSRAGDDLAGQLGAVADQGGRGQIFRHGAFDLREGGVHYEEKWMDDWLWHRRAPHGPWVKASEEQMISRMRKALELIIETIDGHEHKKSDLAWLRGALLTARAAALGALGR